MPYEVHSKLKKVNDRYVPVYDVKYISPERMPTIELAVDVLDAVQADRVVQEHVKQRTFVKQHGVVRYNDKGMRLNSLKDTKSCLE